MTRRKGSRGQEGNRHELVVGDPGLPGVTQPIGESSGLSAPQCAEEFDRRQDRNSEGLPQIQQVAVVGDDAGPRRERGGEMGVVLRVPAPSAAKWGRLDEAGQGEQMTKHRGGINVTPRGGEYLRYPQFILAPDVVRRDGFHHASKDRIEDQARVAAPTNGRNQVVAVEHRGSHLAAFLRGAFAVRIREARTSRTTSCSDSGVPGSFGSRSEMSSHRR